MLKFVEAEEIHAFVGRDYSLQCLNVCIVDALIHLLLIHNYVMILVHVLL